jgi:hypothetical protein
MYFHADPANGPVGTLGTISAPSPLGTWTVTFNKDTEITLTAPNGAVTNFVMPAVDAALFSRDITFYAGVQPNQLAYIGQAAILSGVKISSGANTLLEDQFTTAPLNADRWAVSASNAGCVSLITRADPYWVSWTTPASGFVLQTNSVVTLGTWGDSGLTDTLIGAKKRVLMTGASLPGASQGFFRLVKKAQ